ncbi:Uncharacterised protein [uncultured archaeon]|nr:Uncharacterised protein [uncultured archaeon]
MARKPKKYSELSIYAPKITASDYARIFDQLIRRHIPLFEFLDFSHLFSFGGINLVVKRYSNTIKMFVQDPGDLYSQSALLFPFRLNPPKEVEMIPNVRVRPRLKFVSGHQLFDFLLKENVDEIHLRVIRFLGGFYGFGKYVDNKGMGGWLFLSNPTKFLEIDLENNPLFYIELLDPVPKSIYFSSKQPIFTADGVNIGVDNFNVFQHGLIVGTSGSGKSKFIQIFVAAIRAKHPNSHIVLVDPHGEFSKSMKQAKVIDFVQNYVEPFDVGKSKSPLIAQLIAQLITSTIGQESKYAERVVFYSVHLLASIEQLTMENISLLLTDSSKRMEFTAQCQNDEVKRFFDKEFQDIYMHHFNDAILPVTNFIGEYLLYLGEKRHQEDLGTTIANNPVTVVSFNPHFFSRNIIKFFAGSIINQMYIMAISEKFTYPTVLIVDEFPTVESKVTKDIMAETRKFNLCMYASAQYLGQLSKPVLDSLISNARNVISFKVTKEDARLLASMMEIKVEEFFKKHVSPSELEESKREMFVKLHTRECIIRLFDGEKYVLPMKVRTVDVTDWASVPIGSVPPSGKGGEKAEKPRENLFRSKGPM